MCTTFRRHQDACEKAASGGQSEGSSFFSTRPAPQGAADAGFPGHSAAPKTQRGWAVCAGKVPTSHGSAGNCFGSRQLAAFAAGSAGRQHARTGAREGKAMTLRNIIAVQTALDYYRLLA